MEQPRRLAEGEYRFAALVWANEPLSSGQLVRLAADIMAEYMETHPLPQD